MTTLAPDRLTITQLSPTALSASALNPRKRFLQSSLVDMADSIRSKGVQVPLKARPRGGDAAEIIWGERRWRGAMLVYQGYDDAAGNHYAPQPDLLIPVMVEEMSDEEMFELMMLENLQRQDLAPSEEGAGYARMMEDWGLSTRDVSARLGVPQSRITRFARLLHLPVSVRDRVDAGDLPLYVALEALRVPAEWLGGDARLEALRVAEEAGSAGRGGRMRWWRADSCGRRVRRGSGSLRIDWRAWRRATGRGWSGCRIGSAVSFSRGGRRC